MHGRQNIKAISIYLKSDGSKGRGECLKRPAPVHTCFPFLLELYGTHLASTNINVRKQRCVI